MFSLFPLTIEIHILPRKLKIKWKIHEPIKNSDQCLRNIKLSFTNISWFNQKKESCSDEEDDDYDDSEEEEVDPEEVVRIGVQVRFVLFINRFFKPNS